MILGRVMRKKVIPLIPTALEFVLYLGGDFKELEDVYPEVDFDILHKEHTDGISFFAKDVQRKLGPVVWLERYQADVLVHEIVQVLDLFVDCLDLEGSEIKAYYAQYIFREVGKWVRKGKKN